MPEGNPLGYLPPQLQALLGARAQQQGPQTPQMPFNPTAPEQPGGGMMEKIKQLLAKRKLMQQLQQMEAGRAEAQGMNRADQGAAMQGDPMKALMDAAMARSAAQAQQPIQAEPQAQQPPIMPGMMQEGGDPTVQQMDPRVIEALRRAGAL